MKIPGIILMLLSTAAIPALAQDPVKVSPKYYKIEIDNEFVRVLRGTRGPYEKAPMHSHPDYVAVYLTNVDQKITLPDGKVTESHRKPGEVAFNKAVTHTEENISDKPLEVLVVELKPGVAPSSAEWNGLDPVKVDPKHHKVEFENDRIRVIRSVREPGAKIPMHEHRHYVTIALTNVNSKTTLPDGTTTQNVRKAGEVLWREAVKHSVENVGDERMEEIQIEFK